MTLAEHLKPKTDPITEYRTFAKFAMGASGILWLVVVVALLFFPPVSATEHRPDSGMPEPLLIGFMAAAVAAVTVGAIVWCGAGHRAWVQAFAEMAEGQLKAQDAKLDQLTALVTEQIVLVGRNNALLEQQGHRPRRNPSRRIYNVPRQLGVVALPADVANLTARLDRRLNGASSPGRG